TRQRDADHRRCAGARHHPARHGPDAVVRRAAGQPTAGSRARGRERAERERDAERGRPARGGRRSRDGRIPALPALHAARRSRQRERVGRDPRRFGGALRRGALRAGRGARGGRQAARDRDPPEGVAVSAAVMAFTPDDPRARTRLSMTLSMALHAILFAWLLLLPRASSSDQTITEITLLEGGDAAAAAAAAPSKAGDATARRTLAGATLMGPIADRAVMSHLTPVYPEWAKKEGIEGSVTVYFVVSPEGNVRENVLVQKTAGFDDFDQGACAALRAWRFEPLRDGRIGDQWGTITFHF